MSLPAVLAIMIVNPRLDLSGFANVDQVVCGIPVTMDGVNARSIDEVSRIGVRSLK